MERRDDAGSLTWGEDGPLSSSVRARFGDAVVTTIFSLSKRHLLHAPPWDNVAIEGIWDRVFGISLLAGQALELPSHDTVPRLTLDS